MTTWIPKNTNPTKPRTPTALAKIKGTYQKCRHEDQIADSKAIDFVHNELPTPPEVLNNDGVKYWNRQLSEASKIYGYIGYIDLAVFTELCKVHQEVLEFERMVNKTKNKISKDKNGKPIVNPFYVMLKESRETFLKLSREFGFTPSSRSRIKLERQSQGEDEYDEYEL